MTKRIVLCADDYGQAPAISNAILTLIKTGRLTATSCMVNLPDWLQQAAELKPFAEQVDVGLHFNLTHGQPLSEEYQHRHGADFLSLPRVLTKAFARRFSHRALVAEWHAQLDQFVRGFNHLPRYIDGHQHVHHFPAIRRAFFEVYEERLRAENVYVRVVADGIAWRYVISDPKQWIIQASGAKVLKHWVMRNHVPHNRSFSGVYSFKTPQPYRYWFKLFLAQIKSGGIIMCHPGLQGDERQDPIAAARLHEYAYLTSDAFRKDCANFDVVLKRFE